MLLQTVLQPYLGEIVNQCLNMSNRVEDPTPYYYILKSLFRAISGSKGEMLYREVAPSLQSLLINLNKLMVCHAPLLAAYSETILIAFLQDGTQHPQHRDYFAELCLTVPFRLSALTPFLPHLGRAVVWATESTNELFQHSLRILELCIDNLPTETLDNFLEPIRTDVINALFKHASARDREAQAIQAYRLLGKLGGMS